MTRINNLDDIEAKLEAAFWRFDAARLRPGPRGCERLAFKNAVRALLAPAPPSSVGANIRAERCRRGLTIRQLGEAADVSIGRLSQIETDKRGIGVAVLLRIAAALGVKASVLLGEHP